MNKIEYNPQNRRKKKIYFFFRSIEDHIKNIIIFVIASVISFLNFYKVFSINKILFEDFFDSNAMTYFVFSLSKKYIFLFKFKNVVKIYRRVGFKIFFKNFAPNMLSFDKKKITVSYFLKKNPKILFNFDYFKPFEENISTEQHIILPYYLRKSFYVDEMENLYKSYRNNKKKYFLVFSGSFHSDWYEQFPFYHDVKKKIKILNRIEIINEILKNFNDCTLTVKSQEDIHKINKKTKIILVLSDPSKNREKRKILSYNSHMKLISESKFFITAPGVNMPLSHHIIESMIVGTVPITSSGIYLRPNLDEKNSISFFNKNDLINAIHKALNINEESYFNLRNNIMNYYDKHMCPESFSKKFNIKNFPCEIFTNVDGVTYDERQVRYGFDRIFK